MRLLTLRVNVSQRIFTAPVARGQEALKPFLENTVEQDVPCTCPAHASIFAVGLRSGPEAAIWNEVEGQRNHMNL